MASRLIDIIYFGGDKYPRNFRPILIFTMPRQSAASNEVPSSSSSPYLRMDKFLADSVTVVDKRALPVKSSASKETSQTPAPAPKPTDKTSSVASSKSPEYLAIQQRMLQSMQRGPKTKSQPPVQATNDAQPRAHMPTAAPKRNTPPPAASSGKGRLPATGPRNPQSAPSEAGTNADWWSGNNKGRESKPGPSSVYSYPETAITDRHGEGSISGSEFMQYLNRLESLESQVNAEKERKAKFQEDLKRLNPTAYAALQHIFSNSRGIKDSDSIATSGVP
jgi:hypothetical protein